MFSLRFSGSLPAIAVLLSAMVCGLHSPSAFALDLKPSEIRAKTTEKPVAVLQKRFFEKALRPEFGILSGSLLNEAYTETEKRGLRLAMFFNEWFGVETQYIDTSTQSSKDRKALDQLKFKKAKPESGEDPDKLVTPQPEINRIHKIYDLNLVFAPFYGKLNLMDVLIVYMDTYITFGGSQLETDQGNKQAIAAGIGQRYYFLKSLSLRVDFRNHNFQEKRAGSSTRRNLQSWDIGLSWFFL